MAVFNIYKLNDSDQLDLFFSKHDGKLDLEKIIEKMEEYSSPNENGIIDGEGFLQVKFNERFEHSLIEAFATGQGSLGYYNEAYISTSEDEVKSQRKQQKFYSKSQIIITEDNVLIILFDDTTEEKIKSSIKSLVEKLGFDVSNFRLSDELMRKIRSEYKWTEVKLEKLDNESDSTKKVYYEIDIADSSNESLIDQIYRDHGKMVQISFEMPYHKDDNGGDTPNLITVKLYKNDNRIVLDTREFSDNNDLKDFIIYLTYALLEK